MNTVGYAIEVTNVVQVVAPDTGADIVFLQTRVPASFVSGMVWSAGSSKVEVLVLVVFVRRLTMTYSTARVMVVEAFTLTQVYLEAVLNVYEQLTGQLGPVSVAY